MILNKTTNEQFNIKITCADNFYNRFKGLMLKKDFNNGLLFTNIKDSSIHTLFMRFEIDVYFLDENQLIFEKATLKPWKFYKPKKQAKFILETKKGLLNLSINSELKFK